MGFKLAEEGKRQGFDEDANHVAAALASGQGSYHVPEGTSCSIILTVGLLEDVFQPSRPSISLSRQESLPLYGLVGLRPLPH